MKNYYNYAFTGGTKKLNVIARRNDEATPQLINEIKKVFYFIIIFIENQFLLMYL